MSLPLEAEKALADLLALLRNGTVLIVALPGELELLQRIQEFAAAPDLIFNTRFMTGATHPWLLTISLEGQPTFRWVPKSRPAPYPKGRS